MSIWKMASLVLALGSLVLTLVVGFTLLSTARHVHAQSPCTIYWSKNADGDWDMAANWSLGRMPTPADSVCINSQADVTIRGTHNIADLTIGDTEVSTHLRSAGAFTITHSFTIGKHGEFTNEGGGTFALAGSTLTISQPQGTFINDGLFDLNQGTVTASGFILNLGTFVLTGGTLRSSGSIINEGGTFTLAGGTLSNSGSITNESGAFTLAGGQFIGGGRLALQGGTFSGAGMVVADVRVSGGTLNLGAAVGTLTVAGDYSQSGGTLNLRLDRRPSASSDRLMVGGTASFGGTLSYSFVNGFIPQVSDTFPVTSFNYGAQTSGFGKFGSINGPNACGTAPLRPTYTATNAVLSCASVLPAALKMTVLNAGNVAITSTSAGTTVHESVSVSGSGATPTGTVTFTLFSGNGTCTGSGSSGAAVSLSGGSANSATTIVPAGGLSYRVSYSGGGTYAAATSDCESLTAIQLPLTQVGSLPKAITITADDSASEARAGEVRQELEAIFARFDQEYAFTPERTMTIRLNSDETTARRAMLASGYSAADVDSAFQQKFSFTVRSSFSGMVAFVFLPNISDLVGHLAELVGAYGMRSAGASDKTDAYPYWFKRGFQLYTRTQFSGASNVLSQALSDEKRGIAPALEAVASDADARKFLNGPTDRPNARLDNRGMAAVAFIAQKYGDKAIVRLLKENEYGTLQQFDTLLQSITGLAPDALNSAVRDWLRQVPAPL